MGIIEFKEVNCKHCYKCIRTCHVKSINLSSDSAKILEDECILCGQCFLVCPQSAKFIKSDVEKIKGYIKRGDKVFASLAPSYVGAFDKMSFKQMSAAMKKLGFLGIEETATGATMVSKEYERLLLEGSMENMITSCCPTITMLIERYYPELIPITAPVVSPAVAHAKMLKEAFGNDIRVVFVGPCISKKYEAEKSGVIDAVLIFDELMELFESGNIDMSEEDEEALATIEGKSRLYPVPGGVLETLSLESKKGYRSIYRDGLDNCIEICQTLKEGDIKNCLIELSACTGACLYVPAVKGYNKSSLASEQKVYENAFKKQSEKNSNTEGLPLDFRYKYANRKKNTEEVSEDAIKEVLLAIGKGSESDYYNCGACGYETCRDKAIAVCKGKAEIKMCIPYMWDNMQSMSSLVMENTPNGIFVVDEKMNIVEYNKTAEKMFNLEKVDYTGLPIEMIISTEELSRVISENETSFDYEMENEEGKTFEISIVKMKDLDNYIVFLKDISSEILQNDMIMKMREETLQTAQNVIDKQMIVAQEIASLLGETTAETKSALTKLKKSISDRKV